MARAISTTSPLCTVAKPHGELVDAPLYPHTNHELCSVCVVVHEVWTLFTHSLRAAHRCDEAIGALLYTQRRFEHQEFAAVFTARLEIDYKKVSTCVMP